MEDDELQAIRRARMQQLRGGPSSGAGAGGQASASDLGDDFLAQIGAKGARGGRGGEGGDDDEQQQRAAQMDEQKRQALSTILDSDARERLSRISLVKPAKAQGITNLLIQMAQSGQIRSKVNEAQLIDLLDQVEARQGGNGAGGSSGLSGVSKITYNRKKATLDDDDDFDL